MMRIAGSLRSFRGGPVGPVAWAIAAPSDGLYGTASTLVHNERVTFPAGPASVVLISRDRQSCDVKQRLATVRQFQQRSTSTQRCTQRNTHKGTKVEPHSPPAHKITRYQPPLRPLRRAWRSSSTCDPSGCRPWPWCCYLWPAIFAAVPDRSPPSP